MMTILTILSAIGLISLFFLVVVYCICISESEKDITTENHSSESDKDARRAEHLYLLREWNHDHLRASEMDRYDRRDYHPLNDDDLDDDL